MLATLQKYLVLMISLVYVLSTMSLGDAADTPVVINENAQNPYIMPYGQPLISAHRVGGRYTPQNTLMAFEYMLENADAVKADVFEFDVQITADGELVLLHDLTYDDTSNAAEAFGYSDVTPYFHTLEELQCLNLGENFSIDGEYPYRGLRGEAIPQNLRVVSAKTILEYAEQNSGDKQYRYIIEIKSPGIWGMQCADKLVGIFNELNMTDRVILATFAPTVSVYIAEKYPEITRSAGILEVFEFYYYARMDYDFAELNATYSALQLPYGENVMPWGLEIVDFGTRQLMNYAHKNDIAAQYWTVNSAEDALYLTQNGADALMTDNSIMVYETLTAIENEALKLNDTAAAVSIAAERAALENTRQSALELLAQINHS